MDNYKIISSIVNAKPQITADECRFAHLNRTRVTRILRIFTDPCASAQSVFYCTLLGFICVHLRLIKSIFRELVPHNFVAGLL